MIEETVQQLDREISKKRHLEMSEKQDAIIGLLASLTEEIGDLKPSIEESSSKTVNAINFLSQNVQEIKIDPPILNISTPDVSIPEIKIPDIVVPKIESPAIPEIKIPEIKLPTINVPEPKVTVNVPEVKIPKIEIPEIQMPDSITVSGDVGLRDVDKKNPLPVVLMDLAGNPVSQSSGGGGKSDFFTIKGGDIRITQNAVTDPLNSSTTNLSGGSTFTGKPVSTLGVNSIQVSLKTDKNSIVYVDQSPDGENWDMTDTFNYYTGVNNFGVTVQAIDLFVRVRVKNNTTSTSTYFRLQTVLCPIAEPLPRSLSADGNLKTKICEIEDKYGFEVENTPMDEMRVATACRLVGATFSGTVLDTNFWVAVSGATGTTTVGNSQCVLSTGAGPDGTITLNSMRSARYVGGVSNRYRSVIQLPDTGTTNNVRRWGAFSTNDGVFFELSGTTFKVVTRKTGTDTPVLNGSFNGRLGTTIALDTNVHTYEIYWTNSSVWFVIDGNLIHKVSASSTTWSDSLSLPVRAENINSGGSISDVLLNIRTQTITRLGNFETAPMSYYQSGTTAGVVLKYGAGNLHGLVISGVVNNSTITLYDNIAASGTVIWSSGAMGAQTQPFDLEFHNIPFSTGLTLVISGANSNTLVAYE